MHHFNNCELAIESFMWHFVIFTSIYMINNEYSSCYGKIRSFNGILQSNSFFFYIFIRAQDLTSKKLFHLRHLENFYCINIIWITSQEYMRIIVAKSETMFNQTFRFINIAVH